MQEEFNVASNAELRSVGVHQAFRISDAGEPTHWLSIDHIIILDNGEADIIKINEPNKFDDSGWFDFGHLPSPLHSQLTPERLKRFQLKLNEIMLK